LLLDRPGRREAATVQFLVQEIQIYADAHETSSEQPQYVMAHYPRRFSEDRMNLAVASANEK
jgi:uncharacterized protein YhbP (UPF0306 family)